MLAACASRDREPEGVQRLVPQPSPTAFLTDAEVDFSLMGLDRGGAIPVSDHEIALLDYLGKRVTVADTTGRVLRSMGAPGGGPGELRFPQMVVAMHGDVIGVIDGQKGTVVTFSRTGEPGKEVPLDSLFQVPARRLGKVRQVGAAEWHFSEVVYRDGTRHERLWRRSGDTLVPVDSTMPAPIRPTVYPCNVIDEGGQPPVFSPTLRWDASSGAAAWVTGTAYAVVLAGQARRVVEQSVAPRRATRAAALLQRLGGTVRVGGTGCRLSAEDALSQRSMAAVIPVVDDVRVSPSGVAWVLRNGAEGEPSRIDVFAPTGVLTGRVTEVAFPLFFLTDSTYVAADSTADGPGLRLWHVPSLRR